MANIVGSNPTSPTKIMLTFFIALAIVTGPLAVILLTAGLTLAIRDNITPEPVAQLPSPIIFNFQNYQPYSWSGEDFHTHLTRPQIKVQ